LWKIQLDGAVSPHPRRSTTIGAGKHVVIVGVEGRPSAREEIVVTVGEQIRAGGYFTVEDQSEMGADVRVTGRAVQVSGGPALTDEQIGLWFKVHEWDAELQAVREEQQYQEKVGANYVTRTRFVDRNVMSGNAVIEFAAWGKGGRTITAGREYAGNVMLDDRYAKDDARVAAGKEAVKKFLADLTPRKVTRYVMVDKSDAEQGPMVQKMARGQVESASSELHAYAERHPDNAAAAYNLAVCADAMGDYANALQWYERAISLSGGAIAWYATARDECKRRLDAASALGG